MDRHGTVLGALFLALGIMGLIGMLIVATVFSIGSMVLGTAAMHDPEVPAGLALLPVGFGLFVCSMIALSTIPCLIAAYGLLRHRAWGRVWGLIAGILCLPSFPMGTGTGIYAIWVFLQNEAGSALGNPVSRAATTE